MEPTREQEPAAAEPAARAVAVGPGPVSPAHAQLLLLQRHAGNAAVGRLLRARRMIQRDDLDQAPVPLDGGKEAGSGDRFDGLDPSNSASSPAGVLEKINPAAPAFNKRPCTQNCPAAASAAQNYLLTGALPSSACSPLNEPSGYEISPGPESWPATGKAWADAWKGIQGATSKHGTLVIVEADRGANTAPVAAVERCASACSAVPRRRAAPTATRAAALGSSSRPASKPNASGSVRRSWSSTTSRAPGRCRPPSISWAGWPHARRRYGEMRLGEEAELAGFRGDLVGGYAIEFDDDVVGFAALPRRRNLASAVDRRTSALVEHCDQLAGVADARGLPFVGRRGHVVVLIEAIQRVGPGRRPGAARLEVSKGAAKEGRASAGSAEELQRLHRDDHQREPAIDRHLSRVGEDGVDGQPPGAVLEGVERRWLAVQCHHRLATGGEVERYKHGTARPGGQRPPQREILAIRAALKVMP